MRTRLTTFLITLLLCSLPTYLTSYASPTLKRPVTATSPQAVSPKAQADALYQQGNQLFKRNRWRLALEKYKQALWLYLDLGDKDAIANTLVQIGVVDNWLNPVGLSKTGVSAYVKQAVATRKQILEKLNLKDEGNGREFFQEALKIRREMKDRAGEAAILIKLGETYEGKDTKFLFDGIVYGISEVANPVKVSELYEKAISIYRQLGDKAKQRDALIKLGNFIAKNQNESSDQAASVANVFKRALAIYPANSQGRMETLVKLAYSEPPPEYSSTAQRMKYCQQALEIARRLGDKTAEQDILSKIVLASPVTKDSEGDAAFETALKQVNVLYQIKADKDATRNVLLQLAANNRMFPSRINELRKRAVALYQASGDQKGVADTLLKFARFYISDHIPYKNAPTEPMLKEALSIYQKLGDKRGEAQALYLIGIVTGSCEVDRGASLGFCKPEQGLSFLQKSLELYRLLGDRQEEAQVLSEMASTYETMASTRQGETANQPIYQNPAKANQAIKLYQQASTLYKVVGNNNGMVTTLYNIAVIYQNLGRIDLAKEFYHQALTLNNWSRSIEVEFLCPGKPDGIVNSSKDYFDLSGFLSLGDQHLRRTGEFSAYNADDSRLKLIASRSTCGQGNSGRAKPLPPPPPSRRRP